MQAPSPEFLLLLLFIGSAVGSLAVWLPIAVRWNNYGSVLPYEPRQRVPWNFLGTMPALAFVLLAFVRAIWSGEAAGEIDFENMLWQAIEAAVVLLGFVIVAGMAILYLGGGTARDLGLPRDGSEFRRDVGLGMLGLLAALLPVFLVQFLLSKWFGETSQNPVIKLVQENPDWRIYAAAIISAVIVAPIVEEFIFRLLLQGWLEKVEDKATGYRATERPEVAVPMPVPTDVEPRLVEIVQDDPPSSDSPLRGLIPGISHGFIPIVVSSLLFSLAHLGFGPDPIALFVFGLFLGYLYQRTHRIVPCIVVHMLFNALNLVMLWLDLQTAR